MMNKLVTFRHLAVAGFACLLATSCSDVTDDDTTLPDGKYPMTFTAAVDELTTTRATTDNNSRWTGGEQVNIQVNNTSKTYTATSDGALTSTDGFYWQDKNSINVKAWYPVNFNLANITRQNDGNNYAQLDFLYAPQSSVPFNTTASLTFGHRMAKVSATLKAGSGLTDSELNGATVKFYGYTTATVDCAAGTITGLAANGWITAYHPSGNSYAALVIPQQMQHQKFIRVTVGTGDAARDYFYTPTGEDDANLKAGNQYAYTITVHKNGMVVSADGWESMGDVTGTDDTDPSYTITVTAQNLTDVGITNTTTGTGESGSALFQYAFDATENPVLSFKTGSGYEVASVRIEGRVKNSFEFDGTDGTYRYTLSDVRSDVRITVATVAYTQPTAPQTGDYLYADGTFSRETLFLKTCAGVFYSNKKVVALHDAGRLTSVNAGIVKDGSLRRMVSGYTPKVKDKSWYAPSGDDCGGFYNAYQSSSAVIAASLEKAGGSVPGQIWTTDVWNDNYQLWYNCSTGESQNHNNMTNAVRSFLNY